MDHEVVEVRLEGLEVRPRPSVEELVRMDIKARNIATPAADAPTTQPASVPAPAPVVGRFAPSPSGRMHLGNVFSCLCAWLSARSQGGSIVLRIEDLDDRCKRPELAAQLIDDLAWLGLEWDEGPYYQHDRLDMYEDALRQLQYAGLTHPCFCTRAELCRTASRTLQLGCYPHAPGEHHHNSRVAKRLAPTQHPRAGVRRPRERCSSRARYPHRLLGGIRLQRAISLPK